MTAVQGKTGLAELLETAPSLVFVLLWRGTGDLEAAGWVGCVLALAVLIGFRVRKIPFDTILLGINIHLAVITPLIVGLYALGASSGARSIEDHSYPAVLITIFLTGCVLTFCTGTGFVGVRGPSRHRSWILLAASALAVVWGMQVAGGTLVTVGVPVIGLFVLRRVLQGGAK